MSHPDRLWRWPLALLVAALLVWLVTDIELIFKVLTTFWQRIFGALGLQGALAHLQQGTTSEATTRSLPAGLTYTLAYLGLCLLLLWLLLHDPLSWAWCWRIYAGLGLLCVVLEALARLTGWLLLYHLGRGVLDFLVSPLPVMALLALLTPAVRRQMLGR